MKISVAALFFTLALVSTAQAFTLNSSTNPNMQGWSDPDIKLLVNTANCPSGMDIPGLISEAADVWNKVPSSVMTVAYGGSTSSTTWTSPITVYCETNFQSVTGADQNYVPGAASADTSSGRVARGVLFLNASSGQANIGNYDHAQLTIILAHEIGHLLGLGHSGDSKALMYFDASAKTELSLAQDDMDGISYLYPSNELGDGKYMGCGLVRNVPPPSGGRLALLLACFLMPLGLLLTLRSPRLARTPRARPRDL